MDTVWNLDWRLYPAATVAVLGLFFGTRGAVTMIRGFAEPMDHAGKNLRTMRAMRMMLQGISVAAIGLGWWFHWPVMVAAGAIVGFEETVETSIAAWALKQEFELENASAERRPV